MRNPWQGGGSSRRGRSKSDDRPGTTPSGSPYDFSADHDEQVDPVDLLAIRADDELLDALATGRPVGPHLLTGSDRQLDSGYTDDQQVLAMLQALRADVDSDPFPELVSVEEASKAIVAGQRAARPKRRLMPVATAAAVAVLAMSGVAIGASNAEPGDPLWGVSSVLDNNRAKSVEAAYRVTAALSAAQQALAEGRTADAKAVLASVQPDLAQVTDQERKDELSRKSANLTETVDTSPVGERVDTDENGARRDRNRDRDHRQQGGSGNSNSSPNSGGNNSSPNSGGNNSSPNSGGNNPTFDPRSGQPGFPSLPGLPGPDPRRGGAGPGQESQRPEQQRDPRRGGSPEATSPSTGSPRPAPQSPKPGPESPRPRPESPTPEPEVTRPSPDSTKPAPESRPAGTRPAPDTRPATETTQTTKPSPEDNRPRTRPPTDGGGRGGGGSAGNGGNNNRGNNNGNGGNGEQRHQDSDNSTTQSRGGGGGHTEGAPDSNRGARPTGGAPATVRPDATTGAGGMARPQPTS
jgi:hypothetical protein